MLSITLARPRNAARAGIALGALLTTLIPALPAAAAEGSPSAYTFMDSSTPPARWNPCQRITYKINPGSAGTGGIADTNEAFRRLSASSGLSFEYKGTTTHVPTKANPWISDAQMVISFVRKSETDIYPSAGAAGYASLSWTSAGYRANGSTQNRITRSYAVIDPSVSVPAGFSGSYGSRGELLMHEIGHTVGMGHAPDTKQIMYPVVQNLTGQWGAGDLNGLKALGASQGCLYASAAEAAANSGSVPVTNPAPPPGGSLISPAPAAVGVATQRSEFHPVSPQRVLDTRSGVGAPKAALGPGQSVRLRLGGISVPASGVSAVALNVTAVSPTAGGYITVWPGGETRPNSSNLNTIPGAVTPNLVVAKLGTDGTVELYNSSGNTNLIADLAGYYTPGTGASYQPVEPVRLLDTRNGNGAPTGAVGPGGIVSLQIAGRGGVPETGARAVVLNVTAVSPTANGYVTAWPSGEERPNASNLNTRPKITRPNLVMVKLGPDGRVNLFNVAGNTHLLADVAGYYMEGSGSGLRAVAPVRLLDTRSGLGAPRQAVGPGQTLKLKIAGLSGMPAEGVRAAVLNVTAVSPSAPGYITVFPSGAARPNASNLNTIPGTVAPNLVVVKVGSDGTVSLYNAAGNVNLIADLAGYYTD